MLNDSLVLAVLSSMTADSMERTLLQVSKYDFLYTDWMKDLLKAVHVFVAEYHRPPGHDFYRQYPGVEDFMLSDISGDGFQYALALLRKEQAKSGVLRAIDADETDKALQELHELKFAQQTEITQYTLLHATEQLRKALQNEQKGGFRIGVPQLDDITLGFTYGTCAVIGGMPGAGKTTLMVSGIYEAVVLQGLSAMIYWLEGRKQDLYYSLVSRHSLALHAKDNTVPVLDAVKMKKGLLSSEEFKVYEFVAADLEQYTHRLFVYNFLDVPTWDSEGLSFLVEECEKCLDRPLDIIMLDHLQRMAFYAPSVYDQTFFVNKFIASMGDMAEASGPYGRIILYTSQLNREAIKRILRDKNPDMTAFAQYSEIERSASYGMILAGADQDRAVGTVRLFVVKNRHHAPLDEPLPILIDYAHYHATSSDVGNSFINRQSDLALGSHTFQVGDYSGFAEATLPTELIPPEEKRSTNLENSARTSVPYVEEKKDVLKYGEKTSSGENTW